MRITFTSPARALAVVALSAALLVPAFAQAKAPDTPAGQAIARWIEAVNSGDREQMRAFHLAYSRDTEEGRARADRHAAMDHQLYTRGGGIDLAAVTRSTETEIEAEVTTRNDGNALLVSFRLSATAPHVIEAGSVRPAGM